MKMNLSIESWICNRETTISAFANRGQAVFATSLNWMFKQPRRQFSKRDWATLTKQRTVHSSTSNKKYVSSNICWWTCNLPKKGYSGMVHCSFLVVDRFKPPRPAAVNCGCHWCKRPRKGGALSISNLKSQILFPRNILGKVKVDRLNGNTARLSCRRNQRNLRICENVSAGQL